MSHPTLPEYCPGCLLCRVVVVDPPTHLELHNIFPWLHQARCQTCHADIFFCGSCRLQSFLLDYAQLSRHDAKVVHASCTACPPDPPCETSDELCVEFDNDDIQTDYESECIAPDPPTLRLQLETKTPEELHQILMEPSATNFPHEFGKYTRHPDHQSHPTPEQNRIAEYISDEFDRKGSGLIHMAKFLFVRHCTAAEDHMSLSWVLFSLLLASLLLDTRRSQQSSFNFLLQLLKAKLAPDAILPIPLPTSARQAKFYYIDYNASSTGQTSLLEEFILPKPENLSTGHVYVSLLTTIQFVHAVGQNLEPAFLFDSNQGRLYQSTFLHSRTPRAWELLRNFLNRSSYPDVPAQLTPENLHQVTVPPSRRTSYLLGIYHLIFWSDSFEAFGTKQNRGSVWVMFCSVATPSVSPNSLQNTFNSGSNTYLVAIGPSGKNVSHDCVWARLLVDLNHLNSETNPLTTYSRFHQKVCRSIFPTYVFLQDTPERTESNGLSSWKSNTNVLYGHVSPSLVSRQDRLPSCYSCFYNRLNSLSLSRCSNCSDWEVRDAVPIRYRELQDVVSTATSLYVAGELKTKSQIVGYLRAAAIAPSLSNSIALHLLANTDSPPSTPSLWQYHSHVDVNDSIEVVMHLLFLGIARSLAKDTVYPFLACRKQWSSYLDRVQYIFQSIHKLGIYWIRPQPISATGSFGGWVSENYLAFSRFSKYLGAITDSLEAHDAPYEDPPVKPSQMSLPQLQRWLKARRMDVIKPSGQVRARKCDYLATVENTGWQRPGDLPHLTSNTTNGIPLDLYENVIVSCHSMTASIMSVRGLIDDTERSDMLRAIKIYLSYDHLFHTWNSGGPKMIPLLSNNVIQGAPTITFPTHPTRDNHSDTSRAPGVSHDFPVVVTDDEYSASSSSSSRDAEDGSISDGSGGDLIDDTAPALNRTTAYRIPALAKRNKINLLKIPKTVFIYGTYGEVSELGPKGEGSIQTVKPIVRKMGAVAKEGWAMHVARGWTRRRYSRNAISLTVEAMTAEESCLPPAKMHEEANFLADIKKALSGIIPSLDDGPGSTTTFCNLDAEGWGNLVDAACTGSELPSKRMYFVYKSKDEAVAAIKSRRDPVSIILVRRVVGVDDADWYAVAFKGPGKAQYLLPVVAAEFVIKKCGAAFFLWNTKTEGSLEHQGEIPVSPHHVFTDYGLLLPLEAFYEVGPRIIFYMITYWWKEMLADGSVAKYRC